MTELARCPYCGCPRESPLDSLYREVARIREIAERSGAVGDSARPGPRVPEPREQADQSAGSASQSAGSATRNAGSATRNAGSAARIAELTHEVDELRATVARLRGSAVPGLARSG